MNSQFLFENVFDLTAYPIRNPNFNFSNNEPNSIFGKPCVISGDNHANTLRLILDYIYHGIIDSNPEEHDLCVRLYYTDIEKWGSEEIKKVEEISERAHKNIKNIINYLLIGDEFYDRGNLDYLNLLFIMFPVLFSNHGAEFICCFELGAFDEKPKKRLANDPIYLDRFSPEHRRSALNLQKLIDIEVISKEKVKALIINNYLPKLKLLEFSVSPDGKITVFTHAPSGNKMWFKLYAQFEEALINAGDENKIKAIRERLGIKEIKPYNPSSFSLKEEVAKLKYLNELFNLIKEKRMIHQLLAKKCDADGKVLPNPLADFIWNRKRDDETLGRDYDHFNYGNGHDPHVNNTKGAYELDCLFGKSAFDNEGQYNFLYSYEMFGNDIDDFLENKHIYEQDIESKQKKWQAIKDEIIAAFSKEDFDSSDFLTKVLDSNAIFSDHRIHCLQYLLVKNKEMFVNLFAENVPVNAGNQLNDNKIYDKDAIQSLNNIINNNQIHTLLDIIFELDTNPLFQHHAKMISQKLLKSAHENQYLEKFYQILLLINEYRKHNIEININNIFEGLDHENNNTFIALYYIHLRENLLNSIKGCKTVDYLKLFTVYKDEETLKNVCWIIKMIDLFCTPWQAFQDEKADILQRLVDFMCQPQFKEVVYQEKISKLKEDLPRLPKGYLFELFIYLKPDDNGVLYFKRFMDLITLNFTDGWPKAERLTSVIYILNNYLLDTDTHREKIADAALINLLYTDEEGMVGFVKLFKLILNQKDTVLLELIFSGPNMMRHFLTINDMLKKYLPKEITLDALRPLILVDGRKFWSFSRLLEASKNQNQNQDDFTLSNLVFSNHHVMVWFCTRCDLISNKTTEAQFKSIIKSSIGIAQSIAKLDKLDLSPLQVNLMIEKLNNIVDGNISPHRSIVIQFACIATIFVYVSSLVANTNNPSEIQLIMDRLSDNDFFSAAKLLEKSNAQAINTLLMQHFEGKMQDQNPTPPPSISVSPLTQFGQQQVNNQNPIKDTTTPTPINDNNINSQTPIKKT